MFDVLQYKGGEQLVRSAEVKHNELILDNEGYEAFMEINHRNRRLLLCEKKAGSEINLYKGPGAEFLAHSEIVALQLLPSGLISPVIDAEDTEWTEPQCQLPIMIKRHAEESSLVSGDISVKSAEESLLDESEEELHDDLASESSGANSADAFDEMSD